MADEIKKEDEVVVEPEVTTEVTPKNDETLLAKKEAEEAKKAYAELKALLEAKEQNEKTIQELLAEEKAKNETLLKIAEENEETSKKLKEASEILAKKKAEEETAKLLEQLKDANKKIAEKDKELDKTKKAIEFKEHRQKLAEEKKNNPLLKDAILEAESEEIIQFLLKKYDNQAVIDMAKVNEKAGENAFGTTTTVVGDVEDFDAKLNEIIARKYGK